MLNEVLGTSGTLLVAGAGVSGLGTARLLASLGVAERTIVADGTASARERAAALGVRAVTTEEAVEELANTHLVITSPGWHRDTPLLLQAAAAGLEVIGDVELAYRLDRAGAFGAPHTWIAITGTNGKTTTTGMLAEVMDAYARTVAKRAVACGNIGYSVADAVSAQPRADILVAELSSFQLHWSSQLRPDAGVLLNIAEDHLDWHGSLSAYAADKARILSADIAVGGIDDPLVRAEIARVRPDTVGFTLEEPAPGQVGIRDGWIIDYTGAQPVDIVPLIDISPAGPAGWADALAATAVARRMGVQAHLIASALAEFSVDKHRGETVHVGASTWIDNSKATNPHAAAAALAAYPAHSVVWIAGGQLKGAQVEELIAEHSHRLRGVGLLGVDREIIAEAVTRLAPEVELEVTDSTDSEEAMNHLVQWAAGLRAPTVLLAPAAASLDMYTGMAQRGDIFAAAAAKTDVAS